MKIIRNLTSLLLCIFLGIALCSCGYVYQDIELRGTYTRELEGTVLNVYNWGEYISVGGEDCIDVNKEFERLTGITVNYATYDSNETMYSQLLSGGVSYDIIVPSDYMIERLKNEGMLTKIDTSRLSNFDLVDSKYKGLFFDLNDEYSVCYNVGMVGLIYNSAMVDEELDSWAALWDEKYKNQTLMFNNPRDAFGVAQFYLGQDLNTTNKADWDRAKELLIAQKKNLQSYVMDEVYAKMETGEAAIAPYYAGDYLTMLEVNEDLKFVYPKEGTNIFVDSLCIPKCVKNYEAALMYINYLLEPEIALANAEYIGYASPITAVIENPDYCYYQNEILYPADDATPKTQYFHDIDPEIKKYYEDLWIDIKLH